MDYDLLYKTFDIPKLCVEIAERIKRTARNGIYSAKLSKIGYEGAAIRVEFKTDSGETIQHNFKLDNPASENSFFELLISMNEKIGTGYKNLDLHGIFDRHKDEKYQVFYGYNSEGLLTISIIGRVI